MGFGGQAQSALFGMECRAGGGALGAAVQRDLQVKVPYGTVFERAGVCAAELVGPCQHLRHFVQQRGGVLGLGLGQRIPAGHALSVFAAIKVQQVQIHRGFPSET